MANQDIRWQQRFQNFNRAFALLEQAFLESKERELNELESQGLRRRSMDGYDKK